MPKILFIVVLIVNAWTVNAQPLQDFNALQYETVIELSFTITGGNTCDGIDIFRSNDDVNYELIGGFAGICGSPTEDVKYRFTDTNPFRNSTNYYRLVLGNLGFAGATNVFFIHFGNENILLYPHPVTGRSHLYFSASESELSELQIFDSCGRLISVQEGIRGNYLQVNAENLPAGFYNLVITGSKGKEWKRTFMVQ